MYALSDEAKACEPIPGVPWRDLTDGEFVQVSAAYDAQFSPDQAGSLRRFFTYEATTSERRPQRARAPKED